MIEPRRILLIRPSALGDVCRTVPVLASLRRAFPEARIDWLVRDDFAPAIAHHPALDGVVPFPRRRWGRLEKPAIALEAWRFLRSLRAARYDLALDCQGLARSGLFALATRAPARVGYADAREFAGVGVNVRAPVAPDMHTVDRALALLKAIDVEPVRDMRLHAPPDARARLDERLRGRSFAVLAPTSRWPGKRWPAERFAEVARRLLAESAVERIAVVGGPGEREQCAPLLDAVSRERRIVDLIGSTDVGDLLAIIEASAIVIANDSAALHIAVGFDRPLAALYGPTRVHRVGPYRRERDVIQRLEPGDAFSHKNARLGGAMMARISVEEVVAAALDRLRAANGSASARNLHTVSGAAGAAATTMPDHAQRASAPQSVGDDDCAAGRAR